MAALTIQQAYELAAQQHRAGRLGPAESMYRQILSYQPDHADALSMLGLVACQQGNFAEALELTSRAAALHPASAIHHFNLGIVCAEAGKLDDSSAAYRRAVALQPDLFEAHNNLGNVLRKSGRLDEATVALRQALALRPASAPAHFNLGNVLCESGHTSEAADAFARTIELQPDHAEAHLNLGNLYKADGRLKEAAEHYQHAIRARPGYPEARWSLGLIRLQDGKFEEGWREYEARLQVKDFPVRRDFQQPMWDGSPLNGRRILLHPEGGFGDTLQFIRYVRLLREQRDGRVFVQCQAELKRLITGQNGIEMVFAGNEPLEPFDVHCPLLSLPHQFGTTLDSIPNQVPYLYADPKLVEQWKQRLGVSDDGMKIGLVWAGSARHLNDANRSMPIETVAPLHRIQRARFISLQKERLETPPAGVNFESYAQDVRDFADTAALIAQLDLVICVDTSVAHLAGAMGKPTWVLLPEPAEWRWLNGRSDSPWYPTVRLFRQPRAGDWDSVMNSVIEALQKKTC